MDGDTFARLDTLAEWMRAHGATRAKVDGLELELSPIPYGQAGPPTPRREPPTEEEKRKMALSEKRRKYMRELPASVLTDDFLARLP